MFINDPVDIADGGIGHAVTILQKFLSMNCLRVASNMRVINFLLSLPVLRPQKKTRDVTLHDVIARVNNYNCARKAELRKALLKCSKTVRRSVPSTAQHRLSHVHSVYGPKLMAV